MMVKRAWVLAILAIFGLTACATMQIDIKEPPLPNDVNIIPPSPDLPKDIASFSGKWLGTWSDLPSYGRSAGSTINGLKSILVVEEIHDTWAQVIYSWGDNPWRRSKETAGYNRQACKIISDPKPKIVVSAPLGDIYFEMKDLKYSCRGLFWKVQFITRHNFYNTLPGHNYHETSQLVM